MVLWLGPYFEKAYLNLGCFVIFGRLAPFLIIKIIKKKMGYSHISLLTDGDVGIDGHSSQ